MRVEGRASWSAAVLRPYMSLREFEFGERFCAIRISDNSFHLVDVDGGDAQGGQRYGER